MKFAEYLSTHVTPEWRKQYIHYVKMKDMLYDAIDDYEESAKEADVETPVNPATFYEQFDKIWFEFCDEELHKINTFYQEKLAEAKSKYQRLHEDLKLLRLQEEQHHKSHKQQELVTNRTSRLISRFGNKTKKYLQKQGSKTSTFCNMHELRLAFSEFYLSLILLQNYQKLNATGFRKIQKKHDKLFETNRGSRWREAHVESAPFYTNKENDDLIVKTEADVINELEGGDRPKAMKRLRVPPTEMRQNPWLTFKVGLFLGAFIILLVLAILTGLLDYERGSREYRVVLRLYRGPFLLNVFLVFMSLNIYGWRCSGVNHVLIFELDPRNHLKELHLMEMAAIFSLLWILSILCFLYSDDLNIPHYASPLALVVIIVAFLFNPLKIFHHKSRFWLLRLLRRIICAPFYYVGFADFWLADQLNSLVQVLLDTQYIICFYANSNGNFNYTVDDTNRCVDETWLLRAFISTIPAWCRFMQCLRRYHDSKEAFPHLVNAGKYSTTFFVTLFSTLYSRSALPRNEEEDESSQKTTFNIFFLLWILSAITSSIYAYIWDIKMDWGLFDKQNTNKSNKFLRKEIVYPKFAYYFGIVEDLILRFGWVLSHSLSELNVIHKDILISILSPLELFRRFVWNFFRLENEHLNNCGKFRAVRDISIASLHSTELKPIDIPPPVVVNRKNSTTETNTRAGRRTSIISSIAQAILNDDVKNNNNFNSQHI